MARSCGAKHICKSKCTKHLRSGPTFVVPTSKNGTTLWRDTQSQNAPNTTRADQFLKFRSRKSEAHLPVKTHKTPQHAAVARTTFACQNAQGTTCSDHFLKFQSRARRCGAKHICKSKCTKHRTFGPLFEAHMSKKSSVSNLISHSINQLAN